MPIEIWPFEKDDYDEAVALWQMAENLTLREADRRPAVERYLDRNPGLSWVARDGRMLVAAVLCGHDGRRGYLHHLTVAPSHRRQGLGRVLVARCQAALAAAGIGKCHLFVRQEAEASRAFWRHLGWRERDDVVLMSLTSSGGEGA